MYANYGVLSTEVYETTKPIGKSIDGDIAYYCERLKKVTGKILEAGVGTGRMLIPMLKANLDVEGVDYSPEMLNVCERACVENQVQTTLYQQDLIDLAIDTKYEAIIMPTGSFCLIDGRANALQVLKKFYAHLQNNGKLIIDIMMPVDFVPHTTDKSVVRLSDKVGITMEQSSLSIDWINQKTHSIIKYEKWQEGALIDTELQSFVLSWYGLDEFHMLLKHVGFKKVHCSAGYVYDAFPTQDIDIITFEAIK